VGDNCSTGCVGCAVETGVLRILASERVTVDGGDGGVKAGGVLGGGVHGGSVSGAAWLERGRIRSHPLVLAEARPRCVFS
jgi:hypothetical protein